MARNRDRSANPELQKGQGSTGGNSPSGKDREYRQIVHAIQSLAKEISADGAKNDTNRKKSLFWNKVTAGLVAVYTIFTAGLLVLSKSSVDATRESFTSVQRAFVSVPGLSFRNIGSAGSPRWRLGIRISNSGGTQTQDLITRPLMAGIGADGKEPWSVNIRRTAEGIPWTLGPKEEYRIEINPIDNAVNDTAFTNVIYGVVDYDDTFKGTQHHFTEFCLIFIGLGGKTDIPPEFARCRLHNCADDQCYRQKDMVMPANDAADVP